MIFEGCKPSRRFTNAVAGPHELIALFGSELSVRWHGREIGRHASGSNVAFAAP